jgi:2-phospho-L-lactate guanylyltransferase
MTMSDTATGDGATWDVIVPGKRLFESKSRLSSQVPGSGPLLARSMMEDTLDALRGSSLVRGIIVVTSDPDLAAIAHEYGGAVMPDPDTSLDRAFEQGLHRTGQGVARVAYVVADLPCLTAQIVDQVLALAAKAGDAVVPDAGYRGTTFLATTSKGGLRPRFGAHSLEQHLSAGAVPVGLDLWRARHDVDTWAHLSTARSLGLGSSTADAVDRLASAARQVGDELDRFDLFPTGR